MSPISDICNKKGSTGTMYYLYRMRFYEKRIMEGIYVKPGK
jgi:hypothetical protein